jgi:hypothetical protein
MYIGRDGLEKCFRPRSRAQKEGQERLIEIESSTCVFEGNLFAGRELRRISHWKYGKRKEWF